MLDQKKKKENQKKKKEKEEMKLTYKQLGQTFTQPLLVYLKWSFLLFGKLFPYQIFSKIKDIIC